MVFKAFPFDDRNQRDFDQMTTRIRDGLDLIRKKKTLKATQEFLWLHQGRGDVLGSSATPGVLPSPLCSRSWQNAQDVR